MAKNVFILDAGHGLGTAGKRNPDGTLREFMFNDPTAEHVVKLLADYQDTETHFVYDEDGSEDTPLRERTNEANAIYAKNKGANVAYISIHANAFGDGKTYNASDGIETFVSKKSSTTSFELAKKVQAELLKATGRDDRGVKREDFHVLVATHMPAILVEAGFMTNKEEADLLKTDAYRKKVAQAVVNGLVAQFGLKRKPAPVKPKPVAVAPVKPPAPLNDRLHYRVIAGSFKDKANAEAQRTKLAKAGVDSFLEAFYK